MWSASQIDALQLQQYAMQLQQQMLLASSAPAFGSYPGYATQPNLLDISSDDEDDEEARTLFLANLDQRVTEDILYELFLQAGPLESVRIPKDNTGKQKTFGFITFVHRCSALYAMQLFAGLTLFRKSITIKYQGGTGNGGGGGQPLSSSRRSLPMDCERYRSRDNSSGGSYDNSSMRSSSYSAFYDGQGSSLGNPFRMHSPAQEEDLRHKLAPDWTKGSAARRGERERISKHASSSSRPHHSSGPYERSGMRERERDRERDREHDRERGRERRRDYYDERRNGNGSSHSQRR